MTREEFVEMNGRYDSSHGLTEADYNKAMNRVELITAGHKAVNTPQVGDLVEGGYWDGHHPYKYGLIEKVYEDGSVHICYEPMIPFVYFNDMLELRLSVSGGPFGTHKVEELQLVADEDERYFCDWGISGACANGAINFKAPVRRWKIPYTRQSNTYVNFYKQDSNYGSYSRKAGTCIIEVQLGWCHELFISFEAFKKYADYLGVTYELNYDREDFARYHLSHDFDEKYFWKMEELPEGVKPIYAMCNGYMVQCYFRTMEHDVEFYRPNPNAKNVYIPLSFEEMQRVKKENGWL